MAHHEETHITVADNSADNVLRWRAYCAAHGMKALHIELNTFERQLMCAVKTHGQRDVDYHVAGVKLAGFEVVRVKQEVQPYKLDVSTFDKPDQFLDCPNPVDVVYYECHAKFDGPFRPSWYMSSRDLLREGRWYATKRSATPFNVKEWLDMVQQWAFMQDGFRGPSCLAGWEYEAAILDTNPNLDGHWSSFSR